MACKDHAAGHIFMSQTGGGEEAFLRTSQQECRGILEF